MAKVKSSKISVALAYLAANPGAKPLVAAKYADISPSQLYARLARDKAQTTGVCPVCGRTNDDDAIKLTLTLRRSELSARL